MRIAVWGAGNIGSGIVYRLVPSKFVNEIFWINRSFDKLNRQAADVKHGLAFAPTCTDVHPVTEKRAAPWLRDADVLVLTQGALVPHGKTRYDMFPETRIMFAKVMESLSHFTGIIVVVSNPVDLMTRELVLGQNIVPANRIMGLGTVVETARMRFAIADWLPGDQRPAEIDAFAIGTHDDLFIPIINEPEFPTDAHESMHTEVVQAADRVKGDNKERPGSTLFPIVEGCFSVIETIEQNASKILTVSIDAPDCPHRLCYSLPCKIDASGWRDRDTMCIEKFGLQQPMRACVDRLLSVLDKADGSP